MACFESGHLLKELNHTIITLIPKIPNPQKVGDYQPISLCNVLYKVVAKMMVNRLRSVLGSLVSKFQISFVPLCRISDNILIACGILEFIRKRKKGKKEYFALKLDMNKAYDRVSWDFWLNVLRVRVMGFSQMWIDWIYQCISTVSFYLLVNGSRSKPFVPTCGLRQGDPLSPYLFILVAQAFSDGLEACASNNVCKGIAVSPSSLHILHLYLLMIALYLWNSMLSMLGASNGFSMFIVSKQGKRLILINLNYL